MTLLTRETVEGELALLKQNNRKPVAIAGTYLEIRRFIADNGIDREPGGPVVVNGRPPARWRGLRLLGHREWPYSTHVLSAEAFQETLSRSAALAGLIPKEKGGAR